MEAEILKFLPWASLGAMLAVIGVLVRVSLAYGKTADAAASAKAKSEVVEKDLSAFRLEVASRYVQTEALSAMRNEISASMNRLADRLDKIIDFADRNDRGR